MSNEMFETTAASCPATSRTAAPAHRRDVPCLLFIAGLVPVVFGCGGKGDTTSIDATSPPTPHTVETSVVIETTVPQTTASAPGDTSAGAVLVVDGVEYTCDQVIDGTCGPETETVFARYKDNLGQYINSGSLGPLNSGRYEDAAFAGLSACTFAASGETSYIDFMLADPTFEGAERVLFLPAWFEAQQTLCPDLDFESDVD